MSTKPKILVVDDDSHLLEAFQLWFEKAGSDTLVASHGEEAFRILNDSPVDLILTDFMMPELNGIELIRRLKATNKLPETKVVVMSNNADPEFSSRATELGACAYLLKTIGARAIAQKVMGMLRNNQQHDAPGQNQPAASASDQAMQQSLLALIRMTAQTQGLPDHVRSALKAAHEIAEKLFQRASVA
jgi:DNA-binding response OmpR family regulator